MPETDPEVTILPADWPGKKLRVMPGDLTQYIPQGLGLGGPVIVRPGDTLESAFAAPGFYGMDAPSSDPIKAAPTQEPGGGVIYFDDGATDQEIAAMLSLMRVSSLFTSFAVFAGSSENTLRDRYIEQVRIMSHGALRHFFGPFGEDAPPLLDQPVNFGNYVLTFIRQQEKKWVGFPKGNDLHGRLGGDGDWAKESLAFGFLVENSYWGIYRLWSRPWLVTK